MTKTLVIAEKPSVAQDIVRALTPVAGKFEKHEDHFENDRYVVTSAAGHLVEIQAPEQFDVKRGKWSFAHLPVIPPYFDLKPVDKTKSRLNAVVKQAKRKDVTELINACDAGREGELIFRLIEQYAGGSKPLGKPVKRLWLQSMTPQAIRDGFESLRSDQQMAGLASAARSRDSESMRKLAPVTTCSPAATPERTCALPPDRLPTFTSRGSKTPAPLATKTICRSPVSMTAESGTTTPSTARVESSTSAYMPGLSARPGLGNSKRTLRVRVSVLSVGLMYATRPTSRVPASYGSEITASSPSCRILASYS